MEKQIRDAKLVLLVCTEMYCHRAMNEDAGKGLGLMWQSTIICSYLYKSGAVSQKFTLIAFGHGDTQFIPMPLQPTTYYDTSTNDGYESLCCRLTDQHAIPAGPLDNRCSLPPREPATTQPPQHRTVEPKRVFTYPPSPNFTVRTQERAKFIAWLTCDAHPICALVAMRSMVDSRSRNTG